MGQYTDYYCKDNNKELKPIVDVIIKKHFGWISEKDYDDFYSIAGQAVWYCEEHFDKGKMKTFRNYLIDSLHRKFKTQLTKMNRKKRGGGMLEISLDKTIDDSDNVTFGEMLAIKETPDVNILVQRYLDSLTKKQREIAELMMQGYSDRDIKATLKMSNEQYGVAIMNMKNGEKIMPLKILKERMRIK